MVQPAYTVDIRIRTESLLVRWSFLEASSYLRLHLRCGMAGM